MICQASWSIWNVDYVASIVRKRRRQPSWSSRTTEDDRFRIRKPSKTIQSSIPFPSKVERVPARIEKHPRHPLLDSWVGNSFARRWVPEEATAIIPLPLDDQANRARTKVKTRRSQSQSNIQLHSRKSRGSRWNAQHCSWPAQKSRPSSSVLFVVFV